VESPSPRGFGAVCGRARAVCRVGAGELAFPSTIKATKSPSSASCICPPLEQRPCAMTTAPDRMCLVCVVQSPSHKRSLPAGFAQARCKQPVSRAATRLSSLHAMACNKGAGISTAPSSTRKCGSMSGNRCSKRRKGMNVPLRARNTSGVRPSKNMVIEDRAPLHFACLSVPPLTAASRSGANTGYLVASSASHQSDQSDLND